MVREAISITTTIVSAAGVSGRPLTYGEIAIIGIDAGGTQDDATNVLCLNISDVETYFGAGTDIAVTAAIIFSRGVRQVRCTRAAGTSDVELNAAIEEMKDEDIDFLIYADTLLNSDNAPQFKAIIDKCDTYDWLHMVGASGTVSTIQTDFGNLTDSRNVVGIAAKTANDVAAAVAADYSLKKPWEKLMWMEVDGVTISDYYSPADVDSLEGGDDPVNVVIVKRETDVISDGLTTIAGSDYKYIDVTRIRYWLEALIEDNIEELLMSAEVPYDESGLSQIESRIKDACDTLVEDGGISNYIVDLPLLADISAADKTNRVLNDVTVTATLAGHIQTIVIALKLVL